MSYQTTTDDDIVEALYADQNGLETALLMAAHRLRASGGNIHVVNKDDLRSVLFLGRGAHYTESNIRDYLGYWRHLNVHRATMRRAYFNNPKHVFLCHEHFDEAICSNSAYIQDFFFRIGERWLAGAIANEDSRIEVSLVLSRATGDPPFGEDARKLIGALAPHVRRAASLSLQFARGQGVDGALASGLSQCEDAAFLVDGDLKIAWQNNAAEALLRQDRRVKAVSGRLSLDVEQDAPALAALVTSAVNRNLQGAPAEALRVPGLEQSYIVHVTPASTPAGGLLGAKALALVLVRPVRIRPDTISALRHRYQLTAAEARLAVDIAEGESLEEIAGRRNLSILTLRSQLRDVFAKTGSSRQAGVTALVWKLGA